MRRGNQLTGFYMMGTLVVKGLMTHKTHQTFIYLPIQSQKQKR